MVIFSRNGTYRGFLNAFLDNQFRFCKISALYSVRVLFKKIFSF